MTYNDENKKIKYNTSEKVLMYFSLIINVIFTALSATRGFGASY
jgi:hypothetical protein